MKLLTLDDLYNFCLKNNFNHYSSKEHHNTPIVVSAPGTFSIDENNSNDGLLMTKLRVCHTNLNRNNSFISEQNMKNALPTLKYRPILAYIHQLDNGELDFHTHDMEIIEDENGEEHINYIERQVGAFTASEPYLEYDEKMDKTYVIAEGAIPESYTKTANIIRRKKGTKVSCELAINDLSFNAKEKYLEINDFYFLGCTLLGSEKDGTEIGEVMEGSKLTLEDFNAKHTFTLDDKLVELLEKLNTTLESFQIDNIPKEGGEKVTKFEELLEKYGKTVEDITFEYENLSDEELEAKFAEVFGESDTDGEGDDPEPASDGNGAEGEGDVADPVIETESVKPSKYSITMSDGIVKEFELSLDEIQSALYNLVNNTYSESDNTWYSVSVYESHVIMHDWWNGRNYKQTFNRENDNFNLTGDRVEVFANWLTKEEESSLADMRANYEDLQQFKVDTETAKLHAQREEVLSDAKFESIAETEEFKTLVKNMDEYSVKDLEKEAKVILADKFSATFAVDETKKPKKIGFSVENPDGKEKPYGNLFD